MSKTTSVETSCACGERLKFKAQKPSYFSSTISKVTCSKCKSRFLITCQVSDVPSRGRYKIVADVIYLSESLKTLMKEKLKHKKEA